MDSKVAACPVSVVVPSPALSRLPEPFPSVPVTQEGDNSVSHGTSVGTWYSPGGCRCESRYQSHRGTDRGYARRRCLAHGTPWEGRPAYQPLDPSAQVHVLPLDLLRVRLPHRVLLCLHMPFVDTLAVGEITRDATGLQQRFEP
jgi:hypothetical protein